MGAATDGGVKRGKETRQTTAGMAFRIETEEGNEYTYETGWQIGGTDREETPISCLHVEITAAEAAMYTMREIRKETKVEVEKIEMFCDNRTTVRNLNGDENGTRTEKKDGEDAEDKRGGKG